MEHLNRIGVARIRTPHPEQAAVFLRQHLWCEPVECRQTAVRSGDFEIEFVRWDGALDSCEPDAMLCGLRHIALEADDIHEALARCRASGAALADGPGQWPPAEPKGLWDRASLFQHSYRFWCCDRGDGETSGQCAQGGSTGVGSGARGNQFPPDGSSIWCA